MMKLKTFLVVSFFPGFMVSQVQAKPNILIFFVDDYGWADLGYRNPEFKTPNIDQLKNDGLEFTRAYVATPTCSPSRASLLTGKEAVRLEMPRHITDEDEIPDTKYNYWPNDPVNMPSINYLPLEEVTYAERLKENGYYNMFVGKWHLGSKKYYPVNQGFDAEYGVTDAGHPNSYYQPFFKGSDAFKDVPDDKYLTDDLTDKAVSFIQNYDQIKPFSLSVWHYGVHGPHVGRKDLIEQYKAKGWEKAYSEYGSMVTAMDESLGRIRKALKEKGLDKNTIILLTSDQGGYFTNYPLRGKKTGGFTLGEGGARVPFILYCPGLTKAKTECNVPIQTIDVYPTLVEIASGKSCTETQIQGKSILPLVKGEQFADRNLYFFRSYEDQYAAIIQGDWKLIKYHKGPSELYNVKKDIGEASNLIFNNPSIAKKLEAELAAWEKVAVPLYDANHNKIKN
jgi:arylsulfatase A-like enzyme